MTLAASVDKVGISLGFGAEFKKKKKVHGCLCQEYTDDFR